MDGGGYGVHHFRTNRYIDKIPTLKIAGGVETLGDSGFLQFLRVVSSVECKPRATLLYNFGQKTQRPLTAMRAS